MAGHVFAENRSVEFHYSRFFKYHQSRGAHFRVLQNASSPEFLTCSVSGTCWVNWYGEEPPASCVWDLRGHKEMDRSWVVCELAFAMKVFFGNFNLLFRQHGFEISRKTVLPTQQVSQLHGSPFILPGLFGMAVIQTPRVQRRCEFWWLPFPPGGVQELIASPLKTLEREELS